MGLMDVIVREVEARRTSDIHIAAGLPVRFRVDGALVDMDDRMLTPEDCEASPATRRETPTGPSSASASSTWPTSTPGTCAAV